MEDQTLKTDIDCFEILKFTADLAERESDRGWKRASIMLYASTGLLAILSLTLKSQIPQITIIPCSIGIVFAIAWIQTNKASYYYDHRWHADMEAIIKAEPTLSKWIRARTNPRIEKPFKSTSGVFYFNLLPYSFLILWILIFVIIVLTFIFPELVDVTKFMCEQPKTP